MTQSYLTLSDSARQKLIDDTQNGTTNFVRGYSDILSEIQYQSTMGIGQLSTESLFWYEQAGNINANNLNALGNIFIRNNSLYGLAWDGKVNVNLQEVSDHIANSVITDVINSGKIYDTNGLLIHDIKSSLQYGGVTIGGWGGAFYYWTTPYEGTVTVGDAVLADPFQYNKFLANTTDGLLKTAAAAVQSLAKAPTFDNLWAAVQQAIPTAIQASAPLGVKADIVSRAYDTLLGGNVAGDPNNIFGYLYLGTGPFTGKSIWIRTLRSYLSPEQNVTGNDQLDQLRQARISAQGIANDSIISVPSQTHYLSDLTHYIPTNDSHAVFNNPTPTVASSAVQAITTTPTVATQAIVSQNNPAFV